MTTLLKFLHGIAIMAVGVSFIGTFIICIVLLAQAAGALSMIFVTASDLAVMVSVSITASAYLHYTDSPETLATYIKHKLGSEDEE